MWPFRRKTTPRADEPGERVVSFLSPAEVQALGHLPGEAVLGVYAGGADSPETFRPNRAFIGLLHRVIAEVGARSPELAAGAREQRDGWLYVIDPRTPEGPNGRVVPEDILGAFEVRGGALVPASYRPNDGYRVLTENGMTQLTPAQREAFVAALSRAARGPEGGR
jgi:hypothetical protein